MSLCRCARCENLYYAESEQQCRYHSGHFRMWWSCCKEPLHGAPGCRVGAHVEDVGYTRMLDSAGASSMQHNESFGVLESSDQFVIQGPDGKISFAEVIVSSSSTSLAEQPAKLAPAPVASPSPSVPAAAITMPAHRSTVEEVAAEASDDPSAEASRDESAAAAGGSGTRTVPVPYVVSPHDTFSSICLKHRMSPFEVCRLNGLAPTNRRARVGDVLLVWAERSDAQMSEDLHRTLVRQFRRLTGCSAAEALYYLEGHEYQIGDAIRARSHDASWERERAVVVNVILDEERGRREHKQAEAAEQAEEEAEAARAAELAATERERVARRDEATRALSACLRPRGAEEGGASCLACLG